MKLLSLFLMIYSLNSFAQNSYVPHADSLAEQGTEFQFGVNYFQTIGIIDYDSKAYALSTGTSYVKYETDFVGKYGFTNQLEGTIGLRARMISSQAEVNSTINTYSRSGAESGLLGFKYGFSENQGTKYSLEGWYRMALHTNKKWDGSTEPSEISLGDDSREYAIGLNVHQRTKAQNYYGLRVFYRSPSKDLSTEILSQVEAAYVWRYFSFVAGVENVYSLANDKYSSDKVNKPQIFNGPSALYNSINRSWTAPYGQIGLALGKSWRLEGRYTQVTTGTSTDLGPIIDIRLIKRENSKREFVKQDSKFKEYKIEGSVTKVSKKRTSCIINRGLKHGLKKGMRVDFFYFNYTGGNKLIARGIVIKSSASKALISIKKRYSKRRVSTGTVARAGRI